MSACCAAARAAASASRPAGSRFSAAAWCIRRCCERRASTPSEYTGYAFGMGIERLAMLRYGVNDLRLVLRKRPALPRAVPRAVHDACKSVTGCATSSSSTGDAERTRPTRLTMSGLRGRGRRAGGAGVRRASWSAKSSTSRDIRTPTSCRSARSTTGGGAAADRLRRAERRAPDSRRRSPRSARHCRAARRSAPRSCAAWSRNGMLCSAKELGLADDADGMLDCSMPMRRSVGRCALICSSTTRSSRST